MKPLRVAGMVGALLLTGCERAPERVDSEPHRAEAPAASAHEATSEVDLLRIDQEMLRDLRVTTTAVAARPGGEGVTVLGELEVNQAAFAEVGTPIAARIRTILASPGDLVQIDQSLVQLQSVELGKARAAYQASRAQARLAQQTLERKRHLAGDRIVSTSDVQAAEAAAAAAQAELQAAEAVLRALGVPPDTLDANRGDPSAFDLRSPIAGTVIDRAAVVGQYAEPARPLFRVADLSTLWLTVHAFERDALRIRPGAAARVTFPALPGRTFSGHVALVGRQVDARSRTIPVRIDLANADNVLRPGMSASAWVQLDSAADTIVSVPTAALQRVEGNWSAFIPHGDAAFEIRPVGRGRDLDGEVEVVSGLQPGEMVVVDGAFLLKAEADKARSQGGHDHAH